MPSRPPVLLCLGFSALLALHSVQAELKPAVFNAQTDSFGFLWDVQPTGHVENGKNDCFDGGFRLWVRNADFRPSTQNMTETGEWVLTGKNGAIEITRRILLDTRLGVIRYLEIFKNTGTKPEKVAMRLNANLGNSAQQVLTDRGKAFTGMLEKGDLGLIAMQNPNDSRPSLFWMFGDGEKSAQPVKVESNRTFTINREFDIEPGQSVTFLHLASQRGFDGVVKKGATAFTMFLNRKQLADFAITPDEQKNIVNYRFKAAEPEGDVAAEGPFLSLIEERELERPSQKDMLMLGSSTTLFGSLADGKIEIESQFGKRQIPVADLVAIRGNGLGGGLQIYLKSGEIISGKVLDDVIDFNEASGLKMHLKPEEISLFIARKETPAPKSPAGASGFIEFRSGDRLAMKGEVSIRVTSPWGELAVKTSEIEDLRYVREPYPAYQITLTDGSKIPAMLSADKLTIDSLTFNSLQIPSQTIAGFAGVAEKDGPKTTQGSAECRLVGENKLVGKISTPELHVISDDSVVATKIASEQIVGLERLEEDGVKGAAAFNITLAAGNTFPGQFSERIIEFASSGGRKWRVPLQQITGFQAAKGEAKPKEAN